MSGPVVALSGLPGAGKTTLARAAAQRLGGGLVEYDGFESMTRRSPAEIEAWLERGAPYGEIETPGLARALRAAAARGLVFLDTPLGRAHPHTGPLIDVSIWIDCPADLALARKIAQLARGAGGTESAPFLVWLDGYLAAYERVVRPACLLQMERVAPLAEHRLDAQRQPSRLTDCISSLVGQGQAD